MPAKVMLATRAHDRDYVHERGLQAGEGADLVHARTKVQDHMPASVMEATRAHKHDYVHERARDF